MEQDFGRFLYSKRVQNPKIKYHYMEIDPEEVTLDRPTVFLFGGSGTYGSEYVNGYLKMAENLLGVFASQVDIVGVDYNWIGEWDTRATIGNAKEFVDFILLPHLQHDGKRLELAAVCKAVRQMTILSHCYGDRFAAEIVSHLKSRLLELGYTQEEICLIVKQIFVISFATNPCQEETAFLNIVSPLDLHDSVGPDGKAMHTDARLAWRILEENFENVQISPEDKKFFSEIAKDDEYDRFHSINKFYNRNMRVFVAQDKQSGGLYLATSIPLHTYWYDHSMKFIARNAKDYTKANSFATEVGDTVSKCMLCALCNSVANSILNMQSDTLIPFDTGELKMQLEEVVHEQNSKEFVQLDN